MMKWPIKSKQIFVDKIPIAIASRKDMVTSRDPHEVKLLPRHAEMVFCMQTTTRRTM